MVDTGDVHNKDAPRGPCGMREEGDVGGGQPAEPGVGSAHVEWRRIHSLLVFGAYLVVAGFSSDIMSVLGRPGTDGLDAITVAFFGIIIVCMLTERGRWPVWKRIAFLPASFLAHVVLTVPSGAVMGVLMRSPDHVRTIGEQRAGFLMASFPVLIFSMRQSRLFVRPSRALAPGRER